MELAQLIPLLNVLIIPALVYVVRIDRKLGQLEALEAVNEREHSEMKQRISNVEARA